MSVELDHVFVRCAVDAPEAAALSGLGLQEGPPNTHPGQGTACRRFFFHNAYVELLWVRDERDTPLNEPEFFYIGIQRGRAQRVHEPVAHAIAATTITDVSIGTPVPGQQSMAARSAEAGGVLSFNASSEYVLP